MCTQYVLFELTQALENASSQFYSIAQNTASAKTTCLSLTQLWSTQSVLTQHQKILAYQNILSVSPAQSSVPVLMRMVRNAQLGSQLNQVM